LILIQNFCCAVIANYLELGSRVQQDVEQERLREEARRQEIRLRIQQRRSQEQEQEDTPGKGGGRRSGSGYSRGGARSRRIHQVREEAGDLAPDTAEEEPGAGAGGYTR
jgi:hypothetical protein